MSMICYTSNATALDEKQRKQYEFKTRYRLNPSLERDVRRTNRCPRQFNIDNQRSK